MKLIGNYTLLRHFSNYNIRCLSSVTNESVRQMRNELFDEEKKRQNSLITRVEKIEVKYHGVPENATLMMNKGLSTPFNCAMHMKEFLCLRSAVAEVNGKLWDMHRPLVEDCDLRLLNFHTAPDVLNKVFWRSCSFLLGMVVEKAFKDKYYIQLHSWPKPSVESGSYVYDIDTGIPDWKVTKEELRIFTTMMWKLGSEDNPFERLSVSKNIAMEMFEDNRYKSQQITEIEGDEITLYRVKDHIDISCGPMIASTKFLGTTKVTAVHQLDYNCGYRFQGISIPKQLTLSSFAFGVLANRAQKLNVTGLASDLESKDSPDVMSANENV